jgi:hypothetical protein
MKPVEIFTLNKKSKLVPHEQTYIEQHYYQRTPEFISAYNGSEPCKAVIGITEMSIFQISKAVQEKYDIEPTVFDQYFAVDPVLMDAIEVKHNAELDTVYKNLCEVIDEIKADYDRLSDKLCDFHKKPWYKRIWCAITNNI